MINAEQFLQRYDALDAALVARGFPATSPWWRAEIERFVRSGTRRWVVRAGRRAGKSSTLCRLAVAWALWGDWTVPPGDTAIIPFVSVDRGEASARVKTIGEILSVLGVEHDPRSEEIDLPSKRLVFRVATCSIRSVGFTAVMIVADEQARWESRDTAANPAKEVMASLRPAMATQEHAFEVCSSSPWGEEDYHAALFDAGESEHQTVSFAETWIANPTISEARTHVLEPDPRAWSREYAAIPGGVASAAFDPDQLDGAFEAPEQTGGLFCAIDFAKVGVDGRTHRDHHAFCIGRIAENSLSLLEGAQFTHDQHITEIVEYIAKACKRHRIAEVWSDAFDSQPLEFGKHNLTLHFRQYTRPLKAAAVQALRRMLREGRVSLPNELIISQLKRVQERLTPSGEADYETGGFDLACAAVFTPLVVCLSDPTKYPAGRGNPYAALGKLTPEQIRGAVQSMFSFSRSVHVPYSSHRADCADPRCMGCL